MKKLTKKAKNKCKFCNKSFTQEKTLATHLCPKKKRYNDKDTKSSRLGFLFYQKFYKLTTRAKKPKTFEDFINSQLYLSFIKFGRYAESQRIINPEAFLEYLVKNGIPMKKWTDIDVYYDYLHELMKKEPVEKAIERSLVTMSKWAEKNGESFSDFFRKVNINEATYIITSGRISPWVLYLADSAEELFSKLTEEQGRMIAKIIDPDIWAVRFKIRKKDVEFVQSILKEANL